jgi:hypothetical protein
MRRWGRRHVTGDGGGAASSPGSGGSGAELGVGGLSEGGGDHLCGRS